MALFIFCGIILMILVLLFCPIYAVICFNDSLKLKFKYLFFKFSYPKHRKEGISSEDVREKSKKVIKEESKLKKIIKQKGISGFLKFLKGLTKVILGFSKSVFLKLRVDNLKLGIIVSEEDAAKTAIRYSSVCSVVYSFFGLLSSKLKTDVEKDWQIDVAPCFNSGKKSRVDFYLKVHIPLIYVLWNGFIYLVKFVKDQRKIKNRKVQK